MFIFALAIAAALHADQPKLGAAAFGVVFAAALAGLVAAARRKDTTTPAHAEQAPLDTLLATSAPQERTPVAHTGADEQWSPAREVAPRWQFDGDPFTADLTDIDLDGAPEYAAMVRRSGLDIAWMPESFTGMWSRLGNELERLGDTQAFEAVAA